jgi:hypothetical protein
MTGFLNNGLKRLLTSSQSLLVRRPHALCGLTEQNNGLPQACRYPLKVRKNGSLIDAQALKVPDHGKAQRSGPCLERPLDEKADIKLVVLELSSRK